jgi:8-oxo-dGTP pyrophosphatase MutT (NUDIX family)
MSATIRKVGWIHVEKRRLLCVRSGGRGLFYIPGGKPEPGEDDPDALLREIAEELGVALLVTSIRHAGTFSAPADGNPGKTVVIEAYRADHVGDFTPGFEIAEHRFLASTDAALASAATGIVLEHLKARHVID